MKNCKIDSGLTWSGAGPVTGDRVVGPEFCYQCGFGHYDTDLRPIPRGQQQVWHQDPMPWKASKAVVVAAVGVLDLLGTPLGGSDREDLQHAALIDAVSAWLQGYAGDIRIRLGRRPGAVGQGEGEGES